ncbi:hypothetical protein [Streptomyces sp. NPDC058613]|uniref:hypothetical protein n=1 Tax=unclassified Streptomyces TaxID=2593676 RepID=UPI0036591F10
MGVKEAQYLGQALAQPDVITTTDNYQDGRRIGLHLDDWDKHNYGQKRTGQRRLALNSGPGTRYILLGAVDAQAVCRAVHPEAYAYRYPSTDDYRAHVAAGHPIRCVRIRLARGEGYIAPTEYLLHDGPPKTRASRRPWPSGSATGTAAPCRRSSDPCALRPGLRPGWRTGRSPDSRSCAQPAPCRHRSWL